MCRVTNHKTSHHVLYVAYIQRTMRHLVSTSARTVCVCSMLLILCCCSSSSPPLFFSFSFVWGNQNVIRLPLFAVVVRVLWHNVTVRSFIRTVMRIVYMQHNWWGGGADPDKSTDASLLIHESTCGRDLAVCHGRLHLGQFHSVRHGEVLALRVEQSVFVPSRRWRQWRRWQWSCQREHQRRHGRGREPVFHFKQFLVHYGHVPPTRIGTQSQG